jgi:hypothetical protein
MTGLFRSRSPHPGWAISGHPFLQDLRTFRCGRPKGNVTRRTESYRPALKGLIPSRRLVTNDLATGLIVRPFIVTIATGRSGVGKSTGINTATGMYLAACRTIDSGSRVRKRPAASRDIHTCSERVETVALGIFKSAARNASETIDAGMLPGGGNIQGSLSSSAILIRRRRAHLLPEPATTTCRSLNNTSNSRSSSTAGGSARATKSSTLRSRSSRCSVRSAPSTT